MSKRPIRIKRTVRPGLRRRIIIPQSEQRPFNIPGTDVIRHELVREDPWWFLGRRRGIRRPRIGEDPLEARAAQNVRGTLPERILYKLLLQFRLLPNVDFTFQCVEASTRILTKDLLWKSAAELLVGEEILGLQEDRQDNYAREWCRGIVTANVPDEADGFAVRLSDGTEIITTAEHPWLVLADGRADHLIQGKVQRWFQTQELKPGIVIPRFLYPWTPDKSWEAGYLAGFFDGEGSLVQARQSDHPGWYMTLVATQNAGETFDQVAAAVEQAGFDFSIYDYRGQFKRSYDDGLRQVLHLRLSGGRSEVLRFLGTIRPQRLLHKLEPNHMGRLATIARPEIVSVQSIGPVIISRLATSCHTYIAEGFGMHNSSMEGGRSELGGLVADFIISAKFLVIRIQGPTHEEPLRAAKDSEQKQMLEEWGFRVIDITDLQVYDRQYLEDWTRKMLGYGPFGGGMVDAIVSNTAGVDISQELAAFLPDVRIMAGKVDALMAAMLMHGLSAPS